jgi:hypothetical protein
MMKPRLGIDFTSNKIRVPNAEAAIVKTDNVHRNNRTGCEETQSKLIIGSKSERVREDKDCPRKFPV